MGSSEEIERARAIAAAAVAAMLEHDVPPTPSNYMLWYAHLGGTAPELSRAIATLLANGEVFTEERNEQLFQQFFGNEGVLAAMHETGDRLRQAIARVLRHVETAGGESRAYGKTLDGYSSAIEAAPGADRLRGILGGLVKETRRVAERNALLQSQLTQSSGEIVALRQNLEAVRHEAMTDALTGIANRKSFDERLRGAAREAVESAEPLSLLFLDIDHFKRFNDSYGHQLGDQVLALVARTLVDCVKGRDTTARYGGEEFAIILPNTRLADARRVAEQIRNTMMRRRIVGKSTGEDYGTVTLSIGIAGFRPGEPLGDLLGRADAALYCAKNAGRNRVASEEEVGASLAVPA
ncbi:MAG: GGDEF domain-containing protein [Alphaproteobacteria bacterium]|nr:GGDEF domain-containing protein [Alphaproteobacteria bacterium]